MRHCVVGEALANALCSHAIKPFHHAGISIITIGWSIGIALRRRGQGLSLLMALSLALVTHLGPKHEGVSWTWPQAPLRRPHGSVAS